MSETRVYYLHTNNDLICKPMDNLPDVRDSNFAVALWKFDSQDRETAWSLLVEARSLGANEERIADLAEKWKCDDKDANNYAERVGLILKLDGNMWHCHTPNYTNCMESPEGFGETKLEAMANLCHDLGFEGGKLNWHKSFKDLVSGS